MCAHSALQNTAIDFLSMSMCDLLSGVHSILERRAESVTARHLRGCGLMEVTSGSF